MRLRGYVCLTISLVAWLVSPSVFASSHHFRVMSYNVENLWDDDPDNTPKAWQSFLDGLSPSDRQLIGKRSPQYFDYSKERSNWYSPRILEAKIQSILKVLRLAGSPEIVGLQELESAGNASRAFAMRGMGLSLKDRLESMGYKYFLLGQQDISNPVSVTTGFISKVPLTALEPVIIDHDFPSTSARDIQVVEYRHGGERMLIFNNHWKSKYGSGSEAIRNYTAEGLRRRIDYERSSDPNTLVMVLGDMNASYFEPPLEHLGTTGDERQMLGESTDVLYNLWFELPEDQRWEHSFDGQRQTLSHMLISDDFYKDSGFQYLDQSFKVVGQQGRLSNTLLDWDGKPFRWQVNKNFYRAIHIGEGYSDHLPLLAYFRFKEKPEDGSRPSKVALDRPSVGDSLKPPSVPMLDQIKRCLPSELEDRRVIDFSQRDSWYGSCLKLLGSFPLQASSNRSYSYIDLPVRYGDVQKELKVVVVMNRSYDGRPNIDDSRVSWEDVLNSDSSRKHKFGHPRSNKCFTRKVLKGPGGVVEKLVGRLGFYSGRLALFVATRESQDLVLSSLPEKKKRSCPW